MKKKLLFLPAVVFATSMNLMGAAEQPAPMEVDAAQNPDLAFDVLPVPAKDLIVGYLSDNTADIFNLSLACKSWHVATKPLKELMAQFLHVSNGTPVAEMDDTNLNDYRKAVIRYMNLYNVRKKFGCWNFKQAEFVALQDFMFEALFHELEKRMPDFINYVFIPLGLNVNFQNIVYSETGETLLFAASYYGHLQMVQALLRAHADVNKARTRGDGSTPLYVACQEGNLQVVQVLLGAHADVNKACYSDGETSLYVACREGFLPVVQALMGAGADANKARTKDGSRPLHTAVYYGSHSVIGELLSAGADLDARITDGSPDKNIVGMNALEIAEYKLHEATDKGDMVRAGVFAQIVQAIIDEQEIRTRKRMQGADSSVFGAAVEPESKRRKTS